MTVILCSRVGGSRRRGVKVTQLNSGRTGRLCFDSEVFRSAELLISNWTLGVSTSQLRHVHAGCNGRCGPPENLELRVSLVSKSAARPWEEGEGLRRG